MTDSVAREMWRSFVRRPFPGDPNQATFNLDLASWDSRTAGIVDGIVNGGDRVKPAMLRELREQLRVLPVSGEAEGVYVADWLAVLDRLLQAS